MQTIGRRTRATEKSINMQILVYSVFLLKISFNNKNLLKSKVVNCLLTYCQIVLYDLDLNFQFTHRTHDGSRSVLSV